MAGAHTPADLAEAGQRLHEMSERLHRAERTLSTLIAWSLQQLGEAAVRDLLDTLNPPPAAGSALFSDPKEFRK